MKRLIQAVCLLLITIVFSDLLIAQDTPPAERSVKLHHYDARLTFNPLTKLLQGYSSYDISLLRASVDSIVFYAPGIDTKEVEFSKGLKKQGKMTPTENGSEKVLIKKADDNLIVYFNPPLQKQKGDDHQYQLSIKYTASAPKELHLTGWDDASGRMRKQVWAHRPFGWIPFLDQMCTQDIYFTFDKKYPVVCNGERMEKIVSGDTAVTWHYRLDKPHPFYSVCMVAGDYQYKSITNSSGLPIELWYYPEQADRLEKTYELQSQMFDFFEKETSFKYPYSLYRNIPVADYLYGAMETTTSTVFADFMVVDKGASYGRTFLNTNAHELAHQWFGNCINDKTSDDLWLTESFATYYAKIFEREYLGEEAYENQRDAEFQKALKIAESNDFPLGSGKAGVERWYQKGSLVMDMMRDVLGDDAFKAGIAEYMHSNAYSEAESNDLLKAVYNSSGYALDWFFKEWIFKGGEVEYKVRWGEGEMGSIELVVEQVQKISKPEDVFKMPVNIDVYYTDGSYTSQKIWIEKQFTVAEIAVNTGKDISFVVFDAGRRILKKMTFERTAEELCAQLLQARFIPDRLEAARSLQKITLDKKRTALKNSFNKETASLIKEEIIAQLSGDSLSYDILRKAIYDRSARVRKAVTDNVKTIPASLVKDYESLLNDTSYFIVEAALVNLANTVRQEHPDYINSYLKLTENCMGWRGRNIRIAWLGVALLQPVQEAKYLKELKDYATASFDFETRLNALNQLKKLNYLDKDVAKSLHSAADYWNYKLSNPAKEMINFFSQIEKYKWLLEEKKN